MEFVLGDLIWVYPHDELSWAAGQVVEIEIDGYIVRAIDETDEHSLYRVEKDHALPVHPSCLQGVHNLLDLGEFNEGTLLSNVRVRFSRSEIYTSIGEPILISVNPYSSLGIYSHEAKSAYRKNPEALPPHLYKVARRTLDKLHLGNQSIIISGESGSGKTEAGKIIIDYLADQGGAKIRQKIIDSNPLLEAFGNAKTLKNNNSSRFGKFIELHFDELSRALIAGKVQVYLLEKSRIVYQPEFERNYHFFYQICKGASEDDRKRFWIKQPDEFFYLVQGECIDIEGVDDVEGFGKTVKCMESLGFSKEDVDWVKRICVGILYLGNVDFVGEDKAILENEEELRIACELLMVDFAEMSKVLLTRVIVDPSNKEEIVIPQKPEQSVYTRDATAKCIYSDLFSFIVNKINENIFVQTKKKMKVVGILDIYGFEVFDENSFEQFCINYANEKLQQHFNHHMFKMEQSEYSQEGIDWEHIHYEDNQECIDLIEQQMGIIALLDEQSKLSKGTDKIFLSSLYSKISNSKLSNPGVFKNEFFGIEHYAGTVFYNVQGFLDKNRDFLNPSLQSLLEKSKISFLLNRNKKAQTSSISAISVASQFKTQLSTLIKTLSESTPSFIRCIKPNNEKVPMIFNSIEVQNQLRCAGLLECIRIRKSGYSVRRTFNEFASKYSVLLKTGDVDKAIKKNCERILGKIEAGRAKHIMKQDKFAYQVGKTIIFMKDEFRSCLDAEYAQAVYKQAVKVQGFVKTVALRKKFLKIRNAVMSIACMWRESKRKEREKKFYLAFKCLACKYLIGVRTGKKKLRNEDLGKREKIEVCDKENKESFGNERIGISDKVNFDAQDGCFGRVNEKNAGLSEGFHGESQENPDKVMETKQKRKKIVKEFSENKDIIGSFHEEIRKLDLNLQKEREKNKRLEEQLSIYTDNYENSLKTIQKLKSELETSTVQVITPSRPEKNTSLLREIKSKTHEIEILNLKIQALNQQVEEYEENLNQFKDKEVKWRKNLEIEIKKNNELIETIKKFEQSEDTLQKNEKTESLTKKIKINELLTEVESLRTVKNSSSKEIRRLQDELDLKNQKIVLLEYRVQKEGPDSNNELVELIDRKDDELHECLNQIESLKIEVGISKSMEKTHKSDIEALKKSNSDKQVQIEELQSELNTLRSHLQKANRSILETESSHKIEYNKLIEELKEKVNDLNEEIEERNSELQASKEIYSTLLSVLKLKNSEIDVYKQPSRTPQEITRDLNVIRQREKELLFM